jgi:ankyrin repeat protein
MSIKSVVGRLFHSPIVHLAIVLLMALVCNIPAFCGDIFKAMDAEDLAKVKALLKKNPKLVLREYKDKSKCNDGLTPLHFAAIFHYNKDMAELLLDSKAADVNIKGTKNFEDMTPLHFAAGHNNKDMVELLLSRGANVKAKDKNGHTPLHWAANMGCRSSILTFRKDVMELLLAHGAEVNAKAKDGETTSDIAARCGHQDVVEFLRKHGGHSVKPSLGDGNSK